MDGMKNIAGRIVGFVVFAVVALGGAAPALAQGGDKVFRIGAVSAGAGRAAPHWAAFDRRLAELGYVEGKNVAVDFRNAEGDPARLPKLMAELVRSGVDLLFAPGPEASLKAARDASKTIPIVVVAIDYDPIARGYMSSLSRPGGNITGVFLRQIELTAKRFELLKEMVPNLHDVAVFSDVFSTDQLEAVLNVGRSSGVRVQRFDFRDPPYRFDGPAEAAARARSGALLATASPVFFRQRADLAVATIKHRLPAMVPFGESVEAGVLMAYGANLPDTHRRAADYVDRIIKGSKPADLPMEQPTKFELVINRKTAKTLGLVVPAALLLRADQLIE
jgi:putative ABC transport system substrate-binding protein